MGSNMSVCLSDGTSRNLKTGSDFSSFIQDDKNDPKLCDNVVLKSLSDDEKCLTKELTDIAWKKLLESNKQIFDQVDIPQLDEEFKDDEEESDSEQSVLTELNPTNSPKCPKSPKYPSMCRMERIASVQQMLAFSNVTEKATEQDKVAKFRDVLATGRVNDMEEFIRLNNIRVNHIPPMENDQSSPLHVAIRDNNVQMVELLLKHGGTMHAKDKSGRTPLALAFERGSEEMINMLTAAKDAEYLKSPFSPYAPSASHSHSIPTNTFSDTAPSAFSVQPSPMEARLNSVAKDKSEKFYEEHKDRGEADNEMFITSSRNNSFRSVNSLTFTSLNQRIPNDNNSFKLRQASQAVAVTPFPAAETKDMSPPREWIASTSHRIATNLGRHRTEDKACLLAAAGSSEDVVEQDPFIRNEASSDGNNPVDADILAASASSDATIIIAEGDLLTEDTIISSTDKKKSSKPLGKRLQKAAGKMFSFIRPQRNRSNSGPALTSSTKTDVSYFPGNETTDIPNN